MTELSSKVIFIDKRKTSMRLANAEWEAIDSICKRENIKRNNLLEMINARTKWDLPAPSVFFH